MPDAAPLRRGRGRRGTLDEPRVVRVPAHEFEPALRVVVLPHPRLALRLLRVRDGLRQPGSAPTPAVQAVLHGVHDVVLERAVVRHPAVSGLLDEDRSEEHTSELQSLMRISYAVFCLKKKNLNTST